MRPSQEGKRGEAMPVTATGFEVFREAPLQPRIAVSLKGTIFIVEDDVSVREALEAVIGAAGWDVVTFESAAAFLGCPRPLGPSCLVLDVCLPDLNGLELQARIADDRAEMLIIFITGQGDVPMTVKAMKAGAVEFLTKPFDDDAILEGIAFAISLSQEAIERHAFLAALRTRYESLSRRECQVLAMVVAGMMNKQVAWELGINEITVKAHRGRVMQKMQVRSLAELVKIGAELDLTQTTGL